MPIMIDIHTLAQILAQTAFSLNFFVVRVMIVCRINLLNIHFSLVCNFLVIRVILNVRGQHF